jgi:1-acyl-sn-glycerol-3-phosphate acyltransferase
MKHVHQLWRVRLYSALTVAGFGILYLFTALMILIGIPFLLLKMKKSVLFLIRFWAKSVFFLIGKKLNIEGAENINEDEKYILMANHSSLFDIIAIASFFPGLSWFGHERLTKIPVFRMVLKMTDYIPMKKTSVKNTKEMISQLIEKSKSHNIAIFPEGTRTLNGKVNDFYRGFVILLRNSQINVLPITLNGFYDLKPKNRFYIDFATKLNVTIHRPVPHNQLIDKKDFEIVDMVKSIIESSVISK